jgi:tetrahydromethanopterin S-methyltransferase subunit G
MTVDAPKKRWTGDRLDGLEQKVDDGFAQVDARFEKVDKQFEKVEARFSHLDKKIDRLTYCLLVAAIGYVATHGL